MAAIIMAAFKPIISSSFQMLLNIAIHIRTHSKMQFCIDLVTNGFSLILKVLSSFISLNLLECSLMKIIPK